MTQSGDSSDEEGFDGTWWRYPPLRNALLAGLIAGAGFLFARAGLIAEGMENVFYWLAIPLGGWHWTREGIEELIEEKEVGIEMLFQIVQTAPTSLRARLRAAAGADPERVWQAVHVGIARLLADHRLDHVRVEHAGEPPEQSPGGKYREIIPLQVRSGSAC